MPEETAAHRQHQSRDQQFRPGHSLRAAFAVIPGQDQGDKEARLLSAKVMPRRTLSGQPKLLRDDVDALQQREGRCDIGQRPLH